jgi:hypothetical protein
MAGSDQKIVVDEACLMESKAAKNNSPSEQSQQEWASQDYPGVPLVYFLSLRLVTL